MFLLVRSTARFALSERADGSGSGLEAPGKSSERWLISGPIGCSQMSGEPLFRLGIDTKALISYKCDA
jgi:hypothetical protein